MGWMYCLQVSNFICVSVCQMRSRTFKMHQQISSSSRYFLSDWIRDTRAEKCLCFWVHLCAWSLFSCYFGWYLRTTLQATALKAHVQTMVVMFLILPISCFVPEGSYVPYVEIILKTNNSMQICDRWSGLRLLDCHTTQRTNGKSQKVRYNSFVKLAMDNLARFMKAFGITQHQLRSRL